MWLAPSPPEGLVTSVAPKMTVWRWLQAGRRVGGVAQLKNYGILSLLGRQVTHLKPKGGSVASMEGQVCMQALVTASPHSSTLLWR